MQQLPAMIKYIIFPPEKEKNSVSPIQKEAIPVLSLLWNSTCERFSRMQQSFLVCLHAPAKLEWIHNLWSRLVMVSMSALRDHCENILLGLLKEQERQKHFFSQLKGVETWLHSFLPPVVVGRQYWPFYPFHRSRTEGTEAWLWRHYVRWEENKSFPTFSFRKYDPLPLPELLPWW